MTGLPLTGGCMCGSVRYELDAAPAVASYCHCTRCQRRTGTAAAISARIVPGSLRVVAGEHLVTEWVHPDGGFAKCFCSACGGALWSINPENREQLSVRMGTFDSDPGIRPSFRQFVTYAVPWEPVPDDGLPHYPERPPPA